MNKTKVMESCKNCKWNGSKFDLENGDIVMTNKDGSCAECGRTRKHWNITLDKSKVGEKELIYIEWADATHPEDSGWYSEDGLKRWAKEDSYWVSQVGWILEENKDYLLMASQKATTTSAESEIQTKQWANYLKIPKTWIRKRVDLTKYLRPKTNKHI